MKSWHKDRFCQFGTGSQVRRSDRRLKGRPIGLGLEALEARTMLSVYYVSNGGSDSGAGSSAAPWSTLQHAAEMVKAGDTVDVRAGTYAGFQMGWNGEASGTAGSPITFAAESGAVINSCNAKTADGIDLEGASYITIQGFSVTNPSGSITRAGIRAVTDNHVVVQNNNIDQAGVWGIFTGFSDYLTLKDNVSSRAKTGHGIYVSNSALSPVIVGNTVWGNYACGIHLNGDISQGGTGIITNAVVSDNIIYGNGSAGGSAINLDGVQNSTISNNLLYNNTASGISLFQQDGGGPSKNDVVVNNTVIMPSGSRSALNLVNGSTGDHVYNNILYHASGLAIDAASDSMSGLVSDYNVVVNRLTPDDNTTETLAQWQSATGQDKHSIMVSSLTGLFANSGSNNYQLVAGSAAVDSGTSTNAPTTDLLGNPRPSGAGFDIGAYELQQGTTTSSSTTALATSASSVVAGQSVSFTATVSGGSVTPTGTVKFMDGSSLLGSATLSSGVATWSTASLATGSHSISAIYSGDSNYLTSTSAALTETVTSNITQTSTATALSASASSLVSGQAVTFSATVATSGTTPTGTVKFMDGSTLVGSATLSSGKATWSTSTLAVGSHVISAVYGGDSYCQSSTSPSVTETVTAVTSTGQLLTSNTDVGAPTLHGSTSYNSSTGTYSVTGAGNDIYNSADQFQFAYKTLAGNGAVAARVTSITNTYSWAKAGVMYRNDTSAGSMFVDMVATPGAGVAMQWRSSTGGSCAETNITGITGPVSVKLVRSGNNFTGFYSTDGTNWIQVGTTRTIALSSTALGGLAVTSHKTSALCTATFTNVSAVATQANAQQVSLSGVYNTVGITTASSPTAGNLDGYGYSYSSSLLGTSASYNGMSYTFGTAGSLDAVSAKGQTVALPQGQYSSLTLLATGVNGTQSGTFKVTYSDGTSASITQSFADWITGSGTTVKSMSYRNGPNGKQSKTNRLYAYTLTLDPTKTAVSVTLANNSNIEVLAMGVA